MPAPSPPVRVAATVFAFLLVFGGITATITLIARIAVNGNCGPRWYAACEAGRGELSLGVFALVLGGLLIGWLARTPGRSGPVAGFVGLAGVYGLGGSAAALVIAVFLPAPAGWRILLGVFAVVALFFLLSVVLGFIEETRKVGLRRHLARLYWYLDVVELGDDVPAHHRPGSDDKVARLLATPADRRTLLAATAGLLAASAAGVALGLWFVAAVS